MYITLGPNIQQLFLFSTVHCLKNRSLKTCWFNS